jgi:hypothetical protein
MACGPAMIPAGIAAGPGFKAVKVKVTVWLSLQRMESRGNKRVLVASCSKSKAICIVV